VAKAGPGGGVAGAAVDAFEARYGRRPTHAARAPGRVNLIGEHVDYHDLPVLPFAIERAVTVLFAPASASHASRVRIASAAGGLPDDEFLLDAPIARLAAGDWRNYPRAAAAELAGGGATRPAERGLDANADGGCAADAAWRVARGIDALIVSDLPMAAGLSSSSALVVGVGLALAHAAGVEVERLAFAGRMARGERFVGTRGGGMDQAACLLSRAGFVSRISFVPLRVEHIPFPDPLMLLVATSSEEAVKSGRVREAYNERRASTTDALEVVAAALQLPGASFPDLLAAHDIATLLDAAERALPAGWPDGVPPAAAPGLRTGPSVSRPSPGDDRRLARFRHVVTEGARVARAEVALREGDAEALGALLVASHGSLRDDCEVSTPGLDRLVEAALDAGALGARLTGAGFGGAILALARSGDARRVQTALARTVRPEWVLAVRPSDGAEVEPV